MHSNVYLCIPVVGTCMNTSLFILHYRPCSDNDFIQLDPHPVCSYSCEYSVKCLETSVPWDHLAVSYTHACVLAASFEIAHGLTKHAEPARNCTVLCMHKAQRLNLYTYKILSSFVCKFLPQHVCVGHYTWP